MKNHGSEQERLRGQIPIGKEDFEVIPDVLSNPDTIEYLGKNDTKNNLILFTKAMNGSVYVVEEVRVGRKALALQTMYKRGESGGAHTSETLLPRKQAPHATDSLDATLSEINDNVNPTAISEGEKRFYLQRLQIEKSAVLRGAGDAQAHVAALRPAGSQINISQLLRDVKSDDAISDIFSDGQSPIETLYQSQPENVSSLPVNRGSITFNSAADAPTVIRLMQNADVSTVLHELNHLFIVDLQKMVAAGRGGAQARADLDALKDFAGGKFDRSGMEKIASAWEKYLMDGCAPKVGLMGAFDKIRSWMSSIYQHVAQGAPVLEATPEVRAVFDRMLATDRDIAEAEEANNAAGYWEDYLIQAAKNARLLRRRLFDRYGAMTLRHAVNGTDEHQARIERAYAESLAETAIYAGFGRSLDAVISPAGG